MNTLNAKATLLLSYHAASGPVLVLPNAWDAGSAAVIAAAGARAIATTSGGVSWSLGRADGQRLERGEMVEAVARIVGAVDVPVTADIEAGYGPAPKDVAATVAAVMGAGAVGVNLEDSGAPVGSLFTVEEQVERIRAARDAAIANGAPDLVINARIDVYVFEVGAPEGRLDAVRARALAYSAAGADCVFVPGLLDLAALESLVATSPIAVNAMAGVGGPTVAQLRAVGVRRISVGTGVAQAAYTRARRAAEELLGSGTYDALDGATFADLNRLFPR
jgi:2-methylisocitrate lyase-like PEP mutase family enzyme